VPEILPLSTERLQLRLTRATDAAALLSYYMDPDVVRYTPHEPWTRQSVAGHIAARTHRCGLNGEGKALALVVEDSDGVVGDVVMWSTGPGKAVCELGWAFNPRFHGRGYATEAVAALIGFAFDSYAVHRIEARVDPRNVTSLRLCERLSLRREGVLRKDYWCKGEWTDTVVHGRLRTDEV
jgi:aminoglycoside 6'-N-acetyltransferase